MKDIEKPLREIVTTLQIIHRTQNCEESMFLCINFPQNNSASVSGACLAARNLFERVREGYSKLNEVVPSGHYYRYNDHWRFATQRLCCLAALVIFLEKGFLVEKATTAEILGLDGKTHIHLDLEDYLMGLLNLATELSRFAVNSVTYGDYNRPLQISKFVAELNAGFRLLNLKNDSLRKRFDALKYDVKKIEEVVYDLSLRGLVPKTGETVE